MYKNKNIGLLIIIAFLIFGCPQKGDIMWENTYWILTGLQGEKLKVGPEDKSVYVYLPEGPNGKVEGFAGCNRFFGTCQIDKDQVQFSRMASTKMMCPRIETEQTLLSALETAQTYRIKDQELQLLADGQVLASFVASEEKP